jgi:predicted TIM-barrel fold metal-dependent hydrolase
MYNNHKVIDVHGHVSTPTNFNAYAFALQTGSPSTRSRQRFQLPEGPMQASQDGHIQVLDERNIDVQLISPRPFGMMQWERPKVVGAWTDVTNDAIYQACQMNPTRFYGIGQLRQHTSMDTSNCLADVDHCVNDLGFVGVIVNPDPGGERLTPGMEEPYWFPLYEKASLMKTPLVVHGSCSRDPRTSDNQFGFLVEETLATHRLEQSDVFERYPDLRILVVHCGGALSRFVTRNLSAAPLPNDTMPPGLYFDTCAYDADYLRVAFKQRGIERFAFGTEAPGAGNVINPETGKRSDDMLPLFESMKEITADQKRMLYYDNPKMLFPLLKID